MGVGERLSVEFRFVVGLLLLLLVCALSYIKRVL